MNILFASSEAHPLAKTGGLADVSGSLPRAVREAGQDIRLVLPAYPEARARAGELRLVAEMYLPGAEGSVRVLQGRLPDSEVVLYLIDAPEYFDRRGGLYGNARGDWPDNAERFALFARAVCAIAMDRAELGWRPEVVHCNDWQTGLVPALLSLETDRPATLFTIHNLAYQGLFKKALFKKLQLPEDWWSWHLLEFHEQLSFIKGGLVFSDWITTVSPTYAREICTREFGCGLEGLLQQRRERLTGILNGVDYEVWNPEHDKLLVQTYGLDSLEGKADNKRALQQAFGLPLDPEVPLFGHVGRLVEQKGIDLILALVDKLKQRQLQLVVLGTGQPKLERALRDAHRRHGDWLGVRIEYDERLSHLIEGGSDAFLMPSRFEPCGLNQLYSLRYGTPPVVRRTGGLADSVVDASGPNLYDHSATGFVFDKASSAQLLRAIDRALNVYPHRHVWRDIVTTGMQQDFSWERSAAEYLSLYEKLAAQPAHDRRPPRPDLLHELSDTAI